MVSTSLSRWERWRPAVLTGGVAAAILLVAWTIHSHREKTVDFSRDIRPILNQNCVSCHGGVRQKNNVSFIFRDEALGRGLSGKRTIVPGDPDESELMRRLLSHDPEGHMPYHGPALSEEQISLLRQWIKQGAPFDNYWAFEAPKPEPLPAVKEADWVKQPLDRFVLAKLEQEGLKPSTEANKAELLRRVSLDVIGLPPTPQEEAAFLADQSPNAYEKQVDRLLASPRYGERWAAMWLDIARYSDTRGYEKDTTRKGAWPYRDWVIRAYNSNMPYDQFLIKQLAGDLLPNATMDDRIATAFHRMTENNDEGGTDDEEFRLAAVMDRVATTWNVATGITMNCVQCHSHPYDPIKHVDYYKSIAFFNTQEDADLDDDSPNLRVPKDRARYDEAEKIENEITALQRSITDSDRGLEEKTQWKQLPIDSAAADDISALIPIIPELQKALDKVKTDPNIANNKRAETLVQAKRLLDDSIAQLAAARARGGMAHTYMLRDGEAYANPNTPARIFEVLTAKASVPQMTALRISVPPMNPDAARHTPENGFIIGKSKAWVVSADGKKKPIEFSYVAQDSEENLRAAETEAEAPKKEIAHTSDTQTSRLRLAASVTDPLYIPKVKFADHPPTISDDIPSGLAANTKQFRTKWIVAIPIAPVQIPADSHIEVDLKEVENIANKPAQAKRVRLDISDDMAWISAATAHKAKTDRLFEVDKELNDIPTVPLPVMVEQEPYERRNTQEFERGNILTKIGPELEPDTPAIFPKFPTGVPHNRLTLAKWFFDPRQPLTARVAVNRYWEELFGVGIVETQENFGSVGEEPSDQALLDSLALHFQKDLHWDQKALLREIVTSATYRQSAAASPSLISRDPRNRLMARGPQQRLTAEMVRDQALLASGLLSAKMGGQPVMPVQPAGIWNSVYNNAKWTDAIGPDRYRRGIYTFVKRTSGYPSALIFDASDRDTSLPRRISTNTPLQALVTLNDPVYQEAAEALAIRVLHDVSIVSADPSGEKTLDARLAYETQLVLSRPPTPAELAILRRAFSQTYTARQPGMLNVSMNKADDPFRKISGKRDAFALTIVGSILFNLDAALVR